MRLVVDVLGSDVGRLVEGGGGTLEGAGGGAAVGLLVVDKGDAVGEVVARGLALAHAHRVVDLPHAGIRAQAERERAWQGGVWYSRG